MEGHVEVELVGRVATHDVQERALATQHVAAYWLTDQLLGYPTQFHFRGSGKGSALVRLAAQATTSSCSGKQAASTSSKASRVNASCTSE
jgi:hypothetical protein